MSTASESCESIGQMSLFGETCERLGSLKLPPYLPTPNANEHVAERYTLETSYRHASEGRQVHLAQVVRDARLTSSPQAIPASHSHSPGSDWARRMTATYGRKLSAYWLSCDPPDSWVRTLLGTSIWGSTTCYLTWKKSVTPRGRLLFRLVPSTPRTAGIGSGFSPLWPTPNSSDNRDRGNFSNPVIQRRAAIGKQISLSMDVSNPERLRRTPQARDYKGPQGRAYKGESMDLPAEVEGNGLKLNSAWVSRMMGYPDGWLTLDGQATQ